MSQAACQKAWSDASEHDKACGLDRAHPDCVCEAHSLRHAGGAGVASGEFLARVFTDPASFQLSTGAIVAQKITSVHGAGLSTIRQGASDQEISETIESLLNGGQETQSLVGAAVFEASAIRGMGEPERWFGAYATDDGNKEHHADILGTCPSGSNTQVKNLKSARRNELRKVLQESMIFASDPIALLAELRSRGF